MTIEKTHAEIANEEQAAEWAKVAQILEEDDRVLWAEFFPTFKVRWRVAYTAGWRARGVDSRRHIGRYETALQAVQEPEPCDCGLCKAILEADC